MSANAQENAIRLYLSVVFWGEEYRRYFLDYSLASLMAEGNIPAITDKANARLLIATTEEDWQAIQSEPIFKAAEALIAIEHVPHEVPANVPTSEKMAVMSQAHRKLARRMFEDRAHGSFIYPDMVVATNFLSKLEELARKGRKAVLYMNVRFANEKMLHALQARGIAKHGAPLTIKAPELVRLTIENMHSEMARGGFDSNGYDYGCASFFWVVTPGKDLVFHCGSWVPMLIDYRAIKGHDLRTFDLSTIDGDYVARNFPLDEVYASRSSDELFMISFTPESRLHYSLKPYVPYRFAWLRNLLKIYRAHRYLYEQGILDPIKKEIIRLPIRLRGGNVSEEEWQRVEAKSAAVMRRIERSDFSLNDRMLNLLIDVLRRFYLRVRPAAAPLSHSEER
jgi:hypothetical protein